MWKITMATKRRRSECKRSVVAMVSSTPAEEVAPKAGRCAVAVASLEMSLDACIEDD